MDKFQNKYRIKSTRAPFWDYGWNAMYFVTICTHDKVCWFGDVVEDHMDLSPIGQIANSCWFEIPDHFPFVKLDAFVVMPNHIHGIIIIDKSNDGRFDIIDGNDSYDGDDPNVETQNFASLPSNPSSANKFGPQSKNLASVIRGFKIG